MSTLLCILLLAACPAQTTRLRDIKTVYLDSFGESDGAKLLRAKVSLRLAKHISIADSPDDADAVLSAITVFNSSRQGDEDGDFITRYNIASVVKLTTGKTALWTFEAKTGRLHRRSPDSALSNVADEIADHLLDAIKKDRKH